MLIKDPTTGLPVAVLPDGLLRIAPDSRELLEAIAHRAWVLDSAAVDSTLTKTAAVEKLAHITLPAASKLAALIHRVEVDTDAALRFRLIEVTGTPGAGTSGIFEPAAIGASAAPETVATIWDETAGGITGLTEVGSLGGMSVPADATVPFAGVLILTAGKAIALEGNNVAAEVGFRIHLIEVDFSRLVG